MIGVLLAGHGSHISPNTAGLVWRHVDALRALGIADEVTAAFWKEAPSFHRAVDALASDTIIVVPLFTADGYFTRMVIPAEMGLDGPVTRQHGRTLHYTPSLSGHPYLARVVRQRAGDALRTYGFPPDETAIAVIGHSTRRSPDSRLATEQQADLLRAAGIAAQVHAVFLDDVPEIPEIYALTDARCIVAVPYFLASGSHTMQDVPDALGLPRGESQAQVNGREVAYTPPVGSDDDLLDVIRALASSAGPALYAESTGGPWRGMPGAGFAWFAERFAQGNAFTIGELTLTPERVFPTQDGEKGTPLTTPSQVRAAVRESPFRSLTTARGLPGGWHVPVRDAGEAFGVVETVYPGLPADLAARASGTLRVTPLAGTIARQTGMYRALAGLADERREAVIDTICAGCLCAPLWAGRQTGDALPCAEACNHWLSAALEEPT
jgi:sirohydrochlorin cobaltochelatase